MKQANNKIEKGWGKMESLLDKELPQKKERKFIWWILFPAVLCLAGTWVLLKNLNKGTTAIQNKTEQPLLATKKEEKYSSEKKSAQPGTKTITTPDQTIAQNASTTPLDNKKNKNISVTQKAQSKSAKQFEKATKDNKTNRKETVENKFTLAQPEKSNTQIEAGTTKLPTVPVSSKSTVIHHATKIESNLEVHNLLTLKTIATPLISSPRILSSANINTNYSSQLVVTPEQNKKLFIAAQLNSIYSLNLEKPALEFGFRLERQHSSKWSYGLMAGLGYQFNNKKLDDVVNSKSSTIFSENSPSTNEPEADTQTVEQTSDNNSIPNLRALDDIKNKSGLYALAKLQSSWQINKRLRTGIGVGLMHYGKIQTSVNPLDNSEIQPEGRSVNNSQAESSSFGEILIGYQTTERINIDLAYRHAFKQLFKIGGVKLYNHQLILGLSYRM